MLSYTDLAKGTLFVWNGEPYEVLDARFLRMQQRKAVMQTKIRNLINGKVLERNWQPSDSFKEADIEKQKAIYIYNHRGECWFHETGAPKKRFSLSEEAVGEGRVFLTEGTPVTVFFFKGKAIKVVFPVKVALEVVEAPPSIKGDTAQGGTKVVTLEGGATLNAPLFINTGDVVRVNTETGAYVERVEKNS